MDIDSCSLFHGLPAEDHVRIIDRLKHRSFSCGATVIAEGDERREIYVVQSGRASVFLTDRQGVEHAVSNVGPGGTLGEMSFFTGQPASATVRAATDLDVLVLDESEFEHDAAVFPRLFYNLGAILSQRLSRVNRRAVRVSPRQAAVLLDYGAPPLLGYALACSIAWHTRSATLLLAVASGSPPPELATLATHTGPLRSPIGHGSGSLWPGKVATPEARAHLQIATPSNACAPHILAETLEDLCDSYDHVLVQMQGEGPVLAVAGRFLRLCGEDTPRVNLPSSGSNNLPVYTVRGWTDSAKPGRPDADGLLCVPSLDQADEQALSQGVLPAVTPAGKALGWVARDLTGLKVGLALGAGVAKGYAHIGVLKVLERIGLTIDCLAGASVGAGVAMLHALGHSPDEAAHSLDRVGGDAFRLTVSTRSLLSIDGVRDGLRRIAGDTCFEELHLPLAVVAADIVTGKEVVFRQGLLWPPVLASMAIPGIYPPQQIGAYNLVDGGVVNPVPSNVAADMGADIIIAVKLARRLITSATAGAVTQAAHPSQSVLQTLIRSFEILQSKIVSDTAARATILIEPPFKSGSEYGLRSFPQGRAYIELGENAARDALPRIAAALPWLRQ